MVVMMVVVVVVVVVVVNDSCGGDYDNIDDTDGNNNCDHSNNIKQNYDDNDHKVIKLTNLPQQRCRNLTMMSKIKYRTSNLTPHTSHITHQNSHHTSHLTPHTSLTPQVTTA